MSTFVIAEAGVNHNGSLELALQLVDVAARCGADAVKFQTFTAEKLVSSDTAKAAYQEASTGAGDQKSMLAALELTDAMHRALFDRCTLHGIEFMSTPFDAEATDFLMALGMRRIKIPSGEITNHPFLKHLAGKDVPLILSTGMATLAEIKDAVAVVSTERKSLGLRRPLADVLTVLHCTSNYPTNSGDVNLRAMNTIAEEIKLPIGYSDHTLGIAVSTAAVARGATVIEKHFTLDKSMSGPDHQASLVPEELAAMIQQIRVVEQALGNPCKQPTPSELPVRELVRRSVTSRRNLAAGERMQASDLCLLRPGSGIAPYELDSVIGRVIKRSVSAGTTLNWTDFK